MKKNLSSLSADGKRITNSGRIHTQSSMTTRMCCFFSPSMKRGGWGYARIRRDRQAGCFAPREWLSNTCWMNARSTGTGKQDGYFKVSETNNQLWDKDEKGKWIWTLRMWSCEESRGYTIFIKAVINAKINKGFRFWINNKNYLCNY